jgi:hypothetical protein
MVASSASTGARRNGSWAGMLDGPVKENISEIKFGFGLGCDGYFAEFKLGRWGKIEKALQFYFSRFDLNSKFKFKLIIFLNPYKFNYFTKTFTPLTATAPHCRWWQTQLSPMREKTRVPRCLRSLMTSPWVTTETTVSIRQQVKSQLPKDNMAIYKQKGKAAIEGYVHDLCSLLPNVTPKHDPTRWLMGRASPKPLTGYDWV